MYLSPWTKYSLCIIGAAVLGQIAQHYTPGHQAMVLFIVSGITSAILFTWIDPFKHRPKMKKLNAEIESAQSAVREAEIHLAECEVDVLDAKALQDWDARFYASLPADQKFRVNATPTPAQVDYEKAMMDYDTIHRRRK